MKGAKGQYVASHEDHLGAGSDLSMLAIDNEIEEAGRLLLSRQLISVIHSAYE